MIIRRYQQAICAITALLFLLFFGCKHSNGPTSSGQINSQDVSAAEENVETDVPLPTVDNERTYKIPLSESWDYDKYWVIDGNGNEIQAEEKDAPQQIDLPDLATGEIRYRYQSRDEIQRDREGYAFTVRSRALFDISGNLLIDWGRDNYEPAFGEYIIRQDSRDGIVSADEIPKDYHTALYHVPTGQEFYQGTFSVSKLNKDGFLLCDKWGTPLGVVNSAGEALSGFPPPKSYYGAQTWNSYFIASSVSPYEWPMETAGVEYLLDSSFRELCAYEWISGYYSNLRGDYLVYRDGEENGIFHPDQGVLFSTDGASIQYFDGELAIVQTGSYRSKKEPINAALVTLENKELVGNFSWLIPVQRHNETEPAAQFVGIKDEKAVMIDRTGNLIASSENLAGARSINLLCDGLYTYDVENGGLYGEGLLNSNLEILVPAGNYTTLSLAPGLREEDLTRDDDVGNILLQADKEIGNNPNEPGNIYRSDILNHTGKIIVENVTVVYDVGPDRIALRRGFNIGLMDWNGNWVVKKSIFNNLDMD